MELTSIVLVVMLLPVNVEYVAMFVFRVETVKVEITVIVLVVMELPVKVE